MLLGKEIPDNLNIMDGLMNGSPALEISFNMLLL